MVGALALALASGCGDDGPGSADDAASDSSSGTTTHATGTTGSDAGSSDATSLGTTSVDPDGSDSGSTDAGEDESSSGDPPQGDPVTIAVGYGGMRVRSLDDGLTWQDYTQEAPSGGDDMDLLRGAAWGEGRFVAVGWRLFSSPDGAAWTEHPNPTGQWYGAVAYGNERFLAVGGGGYCARSDDGTAWEACTDATDGDGFVHVRSVLFLDGLFYTADANGVLRSSPDGDAWTVEDAGFGSAWAAIEGGVIVPREETAPAEFATKRLRGGSPIERAEPGTEQWMSVFDVPDDNGVFQANRFAFAEGWVMP
ncbi:MAG: hypothetical protein KDK70_29105 [Myxococcales bacterium]|nr:hypothetical protein [Myxococcales bacterium]